MCGLAAIFAYRPDAPPVSPGELDTVRDAMRPRGPDGAGSLLLDHGRVGLAHRRLSIIDTSVLGAQPMASADGRHVVVFNGEIYNFAELRQELEQDGIPFRSQSDTEVILALYRRHGSAMVGRLRGMFAFALWDGERRGLLLARDPFGIKPLYLADDGRTLRVASQVKALLAGGAVDTAPEPAGHVSFFLLGHVAEPFTLYRGITALPPGSTLWIGADGTRREECFFDLGALLVEAAAAPQPFDPDRLRAALADSVARHLTADVPVGLFLSGGLDSATIGALAGRPPRTITLAFDEFRGGPCDEAPLAEAMARRIGSEHVTTTIAAADFAAARNDILAAMDQPSIDGVNTWFVSQAAARTGLKAVLSGLGGDELFAGYDTFRQVPRLARMLRPFGRVPALGRGLRMVTAGWIGRFASPKMAGLLELGTRTGDAYLLRRGLMMPWELPGVLDADLVRTGWARLAMRERLTKAVSGLPSGRLAVTRLETSFYMRNQLLRDADWAGMSHSLEIRVPLVDSVLYRTLAPMLAGPRPPSKSDMAACAAALVPEEMRTRRKTGFFTPVSQWIAGGRDLRGWARMVHAAFSGKDGTISAGKGQNMPPIRGRE